MDKAQDHHDAVCAIDGERWIVEYKTSGTQPMSFEQRFGIGACDDHVIDMTNVTEWSEADESIPWHEAGELYAIARRGGDAMRKLAFERGPDYHPDVIYGSGNFATLIEETKRGIPAWS